MVRPNAFMLAVGRWRSAADPTARADLPRNSIAPPRLRMSAEAPLMPLRLRACKENATRQGYLMWLIADSLATPVKRNMTASAVLALLVAILAGSTRETLSATAPAANPARVWPQFRGPNGTGVAGDGAYPVDFGPGSNVLWKASLPAGHSSPIVWEDRVFLTGVTNDELVTLCLARADGSLLWQKSVPAAKVERSSRLSNPASSTPATDGQRIYAYFGAFGAVCYDFAGREQWRIPLPPLTTQHGASSSPALTRDLVVLLRDHDLDSHILALRKSDGQLVWRTERAGCRRGFSTPLLISAPPKELLVTAGTLRLVAYDAADGREEWSVGGLPNEICASPVFANGLVFAAGWTPGAGVPRLPDFQSLLAQSDRNSDGFLAANEAPDGPARQHFTYFDANKDGLISLQEWQSMAEIFAKSENALLAVRPGGKGDVSSSHTAWKQKRGLPYVPSPICYQGRVFLVKNGGLVSCFNSTNGAVIYQEERLGALGDYYASPIAAGGRVYLASQPGTVTVLSAGDTFQVLARNHLGEEVLATPAATDGMLLIRTAAHLHAFRLPEPGKR